MLVVRSAKTATKISSRPSKKLHTLNSQKWEVGRTRSLVVKPVMGQGRLTSKKAILPKSFPTRTSRPRRFPKRVWVAMPGAKNGITSDAANTGATTLVALTVTLRIQHPPVETSRGRLLSLDRQTQRSRTFRRLPC